MTRNRRNIGAEQALAAMRRAVAAGATSEADIIAAGVAKLGGDDRARKTTARVWRDNFAVWEAN